MGSDTALLGQNPLQPVSIQVHSLVSRAVGMLPTPMSNSGSESFRRPREEETWGTKHEV